MTWSGEPDTVLPATPPLGPRSFRCIHRRSRLIFRVSSYRMKSPLFPVGSGLLRAYGLNTIHLLVLILSQAVVCFGVLPKTSRCGFLPPKPTRRHNDLNVPSMTSRRSFLAPGAH